MNIVFRADAGVVLGSGHLMRCLTLADAVRARGAKVVFACKPMPRSLVDLIEVREHRLISLAESEAALPRPAADSAWQSDAQALTAAMNSEFRSRIDLLVVDNYALGAPWEKYLRPSCRRLMVIDDLADRAHDCDLLLDQNYFSDQNTRYQGLLVRPDCRTLLGPKYALLRPQFQAARRALRDRDGKVHRLLAFFGGSDSSNQTLKALIGVEQSRLRGLPIDVVVGGANPHREQVAAFCASRPNYQFYTQVDEFASLMTQADLALGAPGGSSWERCLLGLPSILVATEENQEIQAKSLHNLGVCEYLGTANQVKSFDIARALDTWSCSPRGLGEMSRKCLDLVGVDSTRSVVEAMFEVCEL